MHHLLSAGLAVVLVSLPARAQQETMARGARDFRACAPCHSLELDRNMTGPSLANLWGRKAGSLPSFERYSDALKASGLLWDDGSLHAWLTDPERMVPDETRRSSACGHGCPSRWVDLGDALERLARNWRGTRRCGLI